MPPAKRRTDASRRLKERGRAAPESARNAEDYWTLSARPLHALGLLMPLILLYELGSVYYLTDFKHGTQQSVKAKSLLDSFFQQFGLVGMLLPGVALLLVLVIWHAMSRDKWSIKPVVVVGMAMEAALWALPLLVLGGIRASMQSRFPPAMAPLAAADLQSMSEGAKLTISVGAGIYEEFFFRLIGIALVHLLIHDVLRAPKLAAQIIAVAVTSIAFAAYHPQTNMFGASVNWLDTFFFTSAGVYFACVYLSRGFGIVVATHAIYDVIVLIFASNIGL
jgi:membrane protease YdiL (CAAX protease family)